MNFIDLYCGIGGFSLGATRVGMSPVMGYDKDTLSCRAYKDLFGASFTENVDLRTVTTFPSCQVLLASPPLSGLSHLGGKDKDATSLFHAIYNATDQTKPVHCVIETSPFIIKHNSSLFEEIKGFYLSRGYRVYSSVLDARDYNIPQHRERLFIISSQHDDYEFPSLARLENTPKDLFTKTIHQNTPERVTELVQKRLSHIPEGANLYCGTVPEALMLNRKSKYRNVYRRIRSDKSTPTVLGSCGGGNQLYHWEENRPLSVEELMILQGLKLDHPVYGSVKQKKVRIGMATHPVMAELVLRGLK